MSRQTFVNYEEIEERLKKEKTVVSEPRLEESLIKRLCPMKSKKNEIDQYEMKFKLIQKLMKDMSGKLKSNQYSIVFEEPRSRSPGDNIIIFAEDLTEILIPIRKPSTSEILEISPGYFILKCPGKDKTQKNSNDMFESLWQQFGTDVIFSSEKLCKVMFAIVKDGLQSVIENMSEYINLLNFSSDALMNVLIADLEFNKEYLNIKSKEKIEKSEEAEDEEHRESTPDTSCIQFKKNKLLESAKEIFDIKVKIRLIPSITINIKEKTYLISQGPNKQAVNPDFDQIMQHSWFEDCWWKEQFLIDKITAADKFTRLSTYAGLRQICRVEPDLQFITPMHLRHNLLLQLDQNLDDMASSWQKISFFQCFCDQLECLRNQLKNKKIINYFNLQNNLLDRYYVNNGMVIKALQRLDMLLRSKSSLLRSIEDAI